MKKAASGILVSLMAAVILALPAFAGDIGKAASLIQPRGDRCMKCGEGEMIKTDTHDSGWVTIDYVPCREDNGTHLDKYQERRVINYYECNVCGLGDSTDMTYDRYICQ